MLKQLFRIFAIIVPIAVFISCNNTKKTLNNKSKENSNTLKNVPVNPDFFIQKNLLGDIQQETHKIDGIETLCYVIKTNSQPTEHNMGPWCPKYIDDPKEKGGIWFKDGKVYDVDGHFITKLDEFYSDNQWKVFREDASIKVTSTQNECESAARPDVAEEYHNHCVECLPEYYKEKITTYIIPVNSVYNDTPKRFRRDGIGLAFNGVNFDPPAPTHAILAAHTISPLDDHGEHVNPHGGSHYYAATGSTKEIKQDNNQHL